MVTFIELGDTGAGPGKRCLFFLTAYYPEVRFARR